MKRMFVALLGAVALFAGAVAVTRYVPVVPSAHAGQTDC
jgi:hypothetical protein